MDDKAEFIFNEQVHVKEEEDHIKEEPEWEDHAGLHGISAAAARAGLYANHEVKDELVLGPEGVQPADIAFTLYACQASAARAQPVLRDCVRQVADNADVGNQLHSNANIHTEKEVYVCDICTKRFALKTQLMEHVVNHMHQITEQEEICIANNAARAPDAREHPALRDCVVRLERLEVVDLEAGRDERLASRAGRDTDIEKEIHGNIDISAEEETYICDTCKKRFPLKSQLVDHVMIHIQRQESRRGVAGNACQASAARAQPVLRDCVARLERSAGLSADARRPERLLADNADVGNQLHSDANVHTEKQTYVCDVCNKRFALKTQLMEHVMVHIHQEPGQEEILVCVADYARAPDAREHPALRDCVVRLERLEVVDLEAGRDERLASRAGRDTDIEKEIHGNIDISAEEETYICDTCKKWFPLKSQLVDHVMIHIQRQESRRGVAGNARGGRGEGREPTRAQDWRHACLICRKNFKVPSDLKRHELTHTRERPFSCGICNKKFTQLGSLKRHELTHTGERPFSCGICNKKFTYLSSLNNHEQTHTGKRPFSCGICNKKFTRSDNLKSHERTHTLERPFSCGICNEKFTRLGHVKRHERTHTGERPFSCGICNKKFTQLGGLKRHERIHTGEKPYSCGVCNKQFSDSGSLKSHERIHTGERPFSCGICKKKFTQLGGLKIHERTHTREKPFSCGICNKQFAESGSLKSHERIHTGERPFSFGICKKKFTQLGNLKTHERNHTGKRPLSCGICNQKFTTLGSLKSHKLIHSQT